MATKTRRGWGQPPPSKKRRSEETIAAQPFLAFLPDNVLLHVMFYLDVVSLVNLSRVNRRLHEVFLDPSVWTDVDLGFMARHGNVRKLKDFIKRWLGPTTMAVKLKSTYYHKSKPPLVTTSVLDELVVQCPNLEAIGLSSCDLTKLGPNCRLLERPGIRRVEVIECCTSLRWMDVERCGWHHLTHLSLARTNMTSDQDLKIIATRWATTLRSLVLAGCYRVTDAGVGHLSEQGMAALRFLDLSECKALTREGLVRASKLPSLKRLSLAGLPELCQRVENLFMHLSSLTLSCTGDELTRLSQLMPKTIITRL